MGQAPRAGGTGGAAAVATARVRVRRDDSDRSGAAVRSLLLAFLLVVLVIVAVHSAAGRTLGPEPAEAAALRVEVAMALEAERPEACRVEIALHYRGQVIRREAEVMEQGALEIREPVGARFEVGVHGRPCTAEPLVVEVVEPDRPRVEVAVANSAPRVAPEAGRVDGDTGAEEEAADAGR